MIPTKEPVVNQTSKEPVVNQTFEPVLNPTKNVARKRNSCDWHNPLLDLYSLYGRPPFRMIPCFCGISMISAWYPEAASRLYGGRSMILRWLLYVLRMDQEKSLFVLYPTNFLLPTCSMRPINSGVLNISLKQKKTPQTF